MHLEWTFISVNIDSMFYTTHEKDRPIEMSGKMCSRNPKYELFFWL